MSSTGQGEWFTDSDNQWTWRQPDGSCWRQAEDGNWHQLAVEAVASPAMAAPAHAAPSFGFQNLATGASLEEAGMDGSPPHPGPPPPGVVVDRLPGHGASLDAGMPEGTLHLDHGGAHGGHVPDYGHHTGFDAGAKPETSAMAVWALVLSLVPLCYVTTFLGVVLGFEARHHIRHSHGALRGKIPAVLAVVIGLGWFATVPIVVHNGIDLYHSAKTTGQDVLTQQTLKGALSGVDDLEKAHSSFAGITSSNIPNIPIASSFIHFSSTCGTSAICIATGSSFGYTWMEMCQATTSGHAWLIAQTTSGSAWFGEAPNACPVLGDPGSASNQPAQAATWRSGGFPGISFHFSWEWKY